MNSEADLPGFRERLSQLIGEEKPFAWAKRVGIPAGTFDRVWNEGKVPRVEHLARIAAAEDVTLDWLVSGTDPTAGSGGFLLKAMEHQVETQDLGRLAKRADITIDRESWGYVMVPRIDVAASAGSGNITDRENVVDYMAFREDWVRRVLRVDPGNLVLLTSIGDSMWPTIGPGDILLVDVGITRFVDDAIYVLVKRGELVVKRVQQLFSGAVTIKSDNDAYDDEHLEPAEAEQLTVAGRVRWIGRII